jgi:two-component system response regulator AlgR
MTEQRALKVLIADDEPLAAERLQMMLARIDSIHLVGTAHDGESAVRMAEALAPDLVLLDIAMPGLDGIEVARALSRQPVSPAVVFVTAFDQFAVAAFDVAAIDYLMKPVDTERLSRAIERAVDYIATRDAEGTPDEPATPSSL